MPSISSATASADAGRLVLRLMIGVLILFHGVAKLSGGVGPIAGMLSSHGLPAVFAYGAYVGEVVAPVLLVIGLWTRAAALLVVANMLVALALVHMGELVQINPKTGGLAVELQMMYLWGAVAIALLGAGRFSVGGAAGRWN
ncbi:MAG TPA: DoxX family protein [Rhizobacter sp.]|nr:DoxX family protein [Rhizobacter sp.]